MIWLIVFTPVLLLVIVGVIIEKRGKRKGTHMKMDHDNQHITDDGNAIRESACIGLVLSMFFVLGACSSETPNEKALNEAKEKKEPISYFNSKDITESSSENLVTLLKKQKEAESGKTFKINIHIMQDGTKYGRNQLSYDGKIYTYKVNTNSYQKTGTYACKSWEGLSLQNCTQLEEGKELPLMFARLSEIKKAESEL
ncbi:hypothetical protein SAMN04488137_1029 [Fictibacillus solisalsi]|uniref:DUF4362 domain-containing protein n=1 Tax=Fictibacillus solisalsi TaxID=459525 RepID=A0A1G9UN38_9BACL|nr:hypothetical protein [Fictibacillus solisalsi]SDM61328.1 hypothetical protein SAMN04488137_1029 [Fictibacillus solisalsi]